MALPTGVVLKLKEEGILLPADLFMFDKKLISQIEDNLHRPGGRIVDPNDASATIATGLFVFGAKS